MLLAVCCAFLLSAAVNWSQFRGPNASGVAQETNLPVEFGPGKNLIWKTPLPKGHSSPVLTATRIFVTAYEGDQLLTICLDRATGRIELRREAPRPRKQELHKANSPASPSPVTDGKNVYVFFFDFGLLAYGEDGNERWRLPLGPFNNPFGAGASPILSGDTLLVSLDSESGSFFLALDKNTGKELWRQERPDATRGFSTPVLYHPKGGAPQALLAGSYNLTAYDVRTGAPVWWLRGLTWQLKPTPVLDGENLYILGWAGGADEGQQENVPDFPEVLKRWDADADGKLARGEIGDERLTKDWRQMDLDDDGTVGERDWQMYQGRRRVVNAVLAYRLGGKGDITETNLLWKYHKSLPNVPSPLLLNGVLYILKEGGIFTALDARTGAVLKQARLTGALGDYFASPVAADGKIYTVSHAGKVSVLKPGPDWEVIATNDLGEDTNATPAIADSRLYIRTHQAMYCFGTRP